MGVDEDDPGEFDSDANEGFKLRAVETTLSKEWELNVPLFLDITRQSRVLLPQIHLRFKFLPAKADFVLQDISKAKNNYLYEITTATLHVRRMRVRGSIISVHNHGLKSQNAIYHLNHVDTNTFHVIKGVRDFIKDRFIHLKHTKCQLLDCCSMMPLIDIYQRICFISNILTSTKFASIAMVNLFRVKYSRRIMKTIILFELTRTQ